MSAVSVPIDGLVIIAATKLTAPVKCIYSRGWTAWEEWCKDEDVDLVDATDDDLVSFVDTVAGLTPRQRYDFCCAVVRVYKEVGRESFAKSPKVRAVRSELKARLLETYPAAPVGAKAACAYERWVCRYLVWCEANGNQALPAAPEDVAAFLAENAGHYSYYEITAASAGISRYQRENGFPGTSRSPVVSELKAEVKQRHASREKPAGAGTSPSSLLHARGKWERWRLWCSERGVDVMEATSAEVVDYLREQDGLVPVGYLLDGLGTMSRMYESGVDPTDCQEVKAVAGALAKRRVEQQQRNAYGRLAAGEAGLARRGRSSGEEESTYQEVLDLMVSAEEELPPELSEEDVENIKSARAASMSADTLNGYMRHGWKPYEQWCETMGISVEDARPQHVEAYLCLLAKDLLPDVVAVRLNGIRYFYSQVRPFDNPAAHPDVARTMSGIRRNKPRAPSQMSPIRESDYEQIVEVAQGPKAWETERDAIIRGAFDIALIGTMRDGLLRLAEATKAKWRDLESRPDGTGVLTIPMSKTDQEGKSQVVFVCENSMLALDAMRRIKLSLGVVLSADDRIFPLCKESLRKRISAACESAGLEGRYGGHSCRVGMAQDLAVAGFSLVQIMQAGRWDNPQMPAYYIRNLAVSDGAVARWHGRRAGALGVDEDDLTSYGLTGPYVGARLGG